MKKLSATCNQWDVVIVPFPFSTHPGTKRRPALALSNRDFNRRGHTVLAMITTSGHHAWPGDVVIRDMKSAGLRVPCIVRLKLFTLDNRLLLKTIGHLSKDDSGQVGREIQSYLPTAGRGV